MAKKIIFVLATLFVLSSVSAYEIVDYGSEYVSFDLDLNAVPTTYVLKNVSINYFATIVSDVYFNGSDGETHRIFGLGNNNITSDENVIIDNFHLIKDVDYTVTHQATNTTIELLNKIWDGQNVSVDFFTVSQYNLLVYEDTFTGAAATGNDGTMLRNITLPNTYMTTLEQIVVDNFHLIKDVDYSVVDGSSLTNITFLNPLWNEQNIQLRVYEIQP